MEYVLFGMYAPRVRCTLNMVIDELLVQVAFEVVWMSALFSAVASLDCVLHDQLLFTCCQKWTSSKTGQRYDG